MDIRNSDEGKTDNNPSNLLKASDVARRLNISRSLVYLLMQSGEIPTVRIRNKIVRVLEGDLEAFIFNSRLDDRCIFPFDAKMDHRTLPIE